MKLSIIVPTLNEEDILGATLSSISPLGHEIIVVDGGSSDGTMGIARHHTPYVLNSNRGRGIQQHQGARGAEGDLFLFLHADTRLPEGFEMMIRRALSGRNVVFGAFHLSHYPSSPLLDLIAFMANLRSLLLSMPYGDQALFMKRADYFLAGGFRDLPLMEDVDLVQRLKGIGRFKLAEGRVSTSARRYERQGVVSTTRRNWSLILRYLLGQSPRRLHRRLYRDPG